MGILSKLSKAIAARIPGTGAHAAKQRREFEREMRAKGYTWSEVLRLKAEHFKRHD